MWILTIAGDFTKHKLTDEQRDYYVAACQHGQEVIELSDGRVFSNKMNVLVKKENAISDDKNYQELQSLEGMGDDVAVRRKIYLEHAINVRFPYDKFSEEWEEAKQIERGELELPVGNILEAHK